MSSVIWFVAFLVGALVLAYQRVSLLTATVAYGAALGTFAYATYDLTNLATVKDWPWIVTVVDLAWGGILATSVGYLGFLAGKWLQ